MELEMKDLFLGDHENPMASHRRNGTKRTIDATYDYTDESGNLLYQVVRFKPKSFSQRRPDDQGEWIWNLNGVRRVLFRLLELIQADPIRHVFIVEGEKDVLTLERHGLLATCNSGGVGKWDDAYSKTLQGRSIVIIPDNDKAGRQHADDIAASLYSYAKEIRILHLPGLPEKGDVSDWLLVNELETLNRLVEETPIWRLSHHIYPITLEELLKHPFSPRENLISPWLPRQGLAMIYARRGVGKTYLSLSIAYALASGNNLFEWSVPKPGRVLFVDGEMPGSILQSRMAYLVRGFELEPPNPDSLRIITPDLYEEGIPDLASTQGQQQIEENLENVDLLVLDNLSTLFRNGAENDADSWLAIQEWLLKLRRQGKSVLLIHHAGKTGNQRGTSKREDVLDVVIQLRHPCDYNAEDGCRFEIHFEKARHLFGLDAAPFEAMFTIQEDKSTWSHRHIRQDEMERVRELRDQGMSQRQIAEEMEISPGKVNRLCKEIREHDALGASVGCVS